MKYTINCEVAGREDVAYADTFDDWQEARQHLVSLFIAYYRDLLQESPLTHPATSLVIEEIRAWEEGTFRSAAVEPDGPRFFLYPVIDALGVPSLACPRCRSELIATAEVEATVSVGAGPVAFEPGPPSGVRVTCKGGCEAESDVCADLFDALDGFFLTVTWDHSRGPLLSLAGVIRPVRRYRLDLDCGHEPAYLLDLDGAASVGANGMVLCETCGRHREVVAATEVVAIPLEVTCECGGVARLVAAGAADLPVAAYQCERNSDHAVSLTL